MTADKFNAFFNSWIRIRIFHDADSRPNSLPQCGSGSAQLVNLSIKVDTCRNFFFGLIKEDNNFKLNNIFTKNAESKNDNNLKMLIYKWITHGGHCQRSEHPQPSQQQNIANRETGYYSPPAMDGLDR